MTGQVEISVGALRMSSLYLEVTVPSVPAGSWSDVTPPEMEPCWEVVVAGTGRPPCEHLWLLSIRPGSWKISAAEGFC